MPFGEHSRGASEIIGPVIFFLAGDGCDVPLRPFGKLQRSHLDNSVLFGAVGDVDAFIYRKGRDFAEIMVGMRSDGADSVRREGNAVRLPAVYLFKSYFAFKLAHIISGHGPFLSVKTSR